MCGLIPAISELDEKAKKAKKRKKQNCTAKNGKIHGCRAIRLGNLKQATRNVENTVGSTLTSR